MLRCLIDFFGEERNTLKKIFLVILCFLSVLSFVSCGREKEENKVNKPDGIDVRLYYDGDFGSLMKYEYPEAFYEKWSKYPYKEDIENTSLQTAKIVMDGETIIGRLSKEWHDYSGYVETLVYSIGDMKFPDGGFELNKADNKLVYYFKREPLTSDSDNVELCSYEECIQKAEDKAAEFFDGIDKQRYQRSAYEDKYYAYLCYELVVGEVPCKDWIIIKVSKRSGDVVNIDARFLGTLSEFDDKTLNDCINKFSDEKVLEYIEVNSEEAFAKKPGWGHNAKPEDFSVELMGTDIVKLMRIENGELGLHLTVKALVKDKNTVGTVGKYVDFVINEEAVK